MEKTIDDKIKILQTKISVENEPNRKAELNKQLLTLRLRKQIETIQKRIEQLN
jgi:hypothetical protein